MDLHGDYGYSYFDMRVAAQRSFPMDGIQFWVMHRDIATRTKRIAEPIVLKELEESAERLMVRPTFAMSNGNAQLLMDDLWNAGVRPTDMGQTQGALGAIEKHLLDMRTIAFGNIEIELPK